MGWRILLATICGFASWWSMRMAWADWLADSGPPEALMRAVRLEPAEARLRAMDAIVRSDNGDASPAVDRDLEGALHLNPLDSAVLMTLGMRAEFRGDRAKAERYLLRAADVDHQFKPAWTLANFYARANQPDKMWPLLRRCLQLDPFGFDPAPVFDLCWAYADDPDKILALLPRRRPRLIQYFSYLTLTGKTEAAVQVWPMALKVADPVDDAAALTAYPGMLVKAGRMNEAVNGWNRLVDKGVLKSAKLNPAAGVSIADPMFGLSDDAAFSWRLRNADGVFTRKLSPSLEIELDGSEPETVGLLQAVAPVVAGRAYKLAWKADASGLSRSNDAGFRYQINQGEGEPQTVCAMLTSPDGCKFTSGGDVVRIELIYFRAPGSVRAKGALRLLATSLGFAP